MGAAIHAVAPTLAVSGSTAGADGQLVDALATIASGQRARAENQLELIAAVYLAKSGLVIFLFDFRGTWGHGRPARTSRGRVGMKGKSRPDVSRPRRDDSAVGPS